MDNNIYNASLKKDQFMPLSHKKNNAFHFFLLDIQGNFSLPIDHVWKSCRTSLLNAIFEYLGGIKILVNPDMFQRLK